MKPHTPSDLSDCLDSEFSWRRKEISYLKTAFERARVNEKDAIGRACYAALYAYWEGFVREAVQLYVYHVSFRSMKYSDLKTGLLLTAHPNILAQIKAAGANPILAADSLEILLNLREDRLRNFKPDINTRSNLGFDVLAEIDASIGKLGLCDLVDQHSLDDQLKGKRNRIAHGRSVTIQFDEFSKLVDAVTSWMQAIISCLVNAAVLQRYAA